MPKIMLLNIQPDEERVAIVEDNRLLSLGVETSSTRTLKGNVYKGIIRKVEPSLQACFVDYGTTKNGFLPRSEIRYPEGVDHSKGPPSIHTLVREGQELMVQVVRDAIGNKGVTFSTFVTLAGRFLVLVPENERTAISRKISSTDRSRIKTIAQNLSVPEEYGLIIRTAAAEKTQKEIVSDLEYLKQLFEAIHEGYARQKGLGLVYQEADLSLRFIRDYLTDDIEQIYIDDRDAYDRVRNFMNHVMPDSVSKLQIDQGGIPLFLRFGIEESVEETFARSVALPSGGYIVIDQTEAMVTVDVNSGRVKEKDIEDTAFRTNIEASKAVAHQLQLRDLGGLIVIDFIDMRDSSRRREVEKALKAEMAKDKARHRLGRISRFGLLELTRQRIRATSLRQTFAPCNHCNGSGVLRSVPSSAMKMLRIIQEAAVTKKANVVRVSAPVNVANFLLNRRRRLLAGIEEQTRCHIDVVADPSVTLSNVSVEYISVPREDLPEDKEIRFSEHVQLHPLEPGASASRTALLDGLVDAVSLDAEFDPSSTQKIGSFFRKLFSNKSSGAEIDEFQGHEASDSQRILLSWDDEEDIDAVDDLDVQPRKRHPMPTTQTSTDGERKSFSHSNEARSSRRGRQRGRRRPVSKGPLQGGSVEIERQAAIAAANLSNAPSKSGGRESNQEDGWSRPTEEGGEQRRRRRRRRRRLPTDRMGGTGEESQSSRTENRTGNETSQAAPTQQNTQPFDTAQLRGPPPPPTARKPPAKRLKTDQGSKGDTSLPPMPPPVPRKAPALPETSPSNSDSPSPAPIPKPSGRSWGQVIDLRKSGDQTQPTGNE